jgi:predicted nucleotide-binding protein
MPILLAEDEPGDMENWRKVLEARQYSVVEAWTYAAAEQRLNQGGIDVAVVDLYLEGPNGPPRGRELAMRFGDKLPVIILTNQPNARVAVEALHSKACDFVEKIDGPERLLAAVDSAHRRRVFVVHGHDLDALGMIQDFLRSHHLWPIILQGEPGAGLAIIDKVEKYANVSFASVLLTPDDVGGRKMPNGKVVLRPRPRQNVLFELGYFIGKLGRSRTAVLCKDDEDMELLSDYKGMQYISLSAVDWREQFVREMQAGGVAVASR